MAQAIEQEQLKRICDASAKLSAKVIVAMKEVLMIEAALQGCGLKDTIWNDPPLDVVGEVERGEDDSYRPVCFKLGFGDHAPGEFGFIICRLVAVGEKNNDGEYEQWENDGIWPLSKMSRGVQAAALQQLPAFLSLIVAGDPFHRGHAIAENLEKTAERVGRQILQIGVTARELAGTETKTKKPSA